jgi:hypothetical protein
MLEEDTERRGAGRGAPRFYWIRQESFDKAVGNVFPTADEVKKISEGGGGDRTERTESQPVDIVGASRLSGQFPETVRKAPADEQKSGETEPFRTVSEECPDRRDGPYNSKTYHSVHSVRPPPSPSSVRDGSQKRENAQKSSDLTAEEAYAAACWGGVSFELWPDGAGFTPTWPGNRIDPLIDEALAAHSAGVLAILKANEGAPKATRTRV